MLGFLSIVNIFDVYVYLFPDEVISYTSDYKIVFPGPSTGKSSRCEAGIWVKDVHTGQFKQLCTNREMLFKKEGKEWMSYGSPRGSMNSARILSIIGLPTNSAHLQGRQLHRIIGTFSKVNKLKYRKLAQVDFRYAMSIRTPPK